MTAALPPVPAPQAALPLCLTSFATASALVGSSCASDSPRMDSFISAVQLALWVLSLSSTPSSRCTGWVCGAGGKEFADT